MSDLDVQVEELVCKFVEDVPYWEMFGEEDIRRAIRAGIELQRGMDDDWLGRLLDMAKRDGVREENEACAKLVESQPDRSSMSSEVWRINTVYADLLAERIRARRKP